MVANMAQPTMVDKHDISSFAAVPMPPPNMSPRRDLSKPFRESQVSQNAENENDQYYDPESVPVRRKVPVASSDQHPYDTPLQPDENLPPATDLAYISHATHNISLTDNPVPVQTYVPRTASRQSYKSTASSQQYLEDLPEGQMVQSESAPQLQYFHNADVPARKVVNRLSSLQPGNASPSSSVGDYQSHLQLPRTNMQRPNSSTSLGSDASGMRYSPSPQDDIMGGSPRNYQRNVSNNRRSPDARPQSYMDLLTEVPYAQQVAPSPAMNNAALQMVVGNNASLLDTKKTLEMYRVNVKKSNDPAIQYEFAIFMINMAGESIKNGQSTGADETAGEFIKEARQILQRLADRGYPFAQYYLADGYFSGFFNKDKPDFEKAYALFLAASKHGHAEASYRTALCYEAGWGTAKALPKAVQFYRNAASKGHPGAAVRLGMACINGSMGLENKYGEGVKWLKRAQESADAQYNSGPYELGMLHIEGCGRDIFKDEAYAAQLLTQSAELGHMEANFKMGQVYERGLLGCPRDPALSVHFYHGAAQKELPDAMMALCAWYWVGAEPVLDKDEGEAYAWAKKAAELGTFVFLPYCLCAR